MKKKNNEVLLVSFLDLVDRNRALISFLAVLVSIVLLRIFISFLFPQPILEKTVENMLHFFSLKNALPLEFDPGGWIGLLAMILGTLMIVISIASQSTPKLIDLYMNDWFSLIYIWFITLTFLHNTLTKIAPDAGESASLNIFLNSFIFLPLAVLFAVPYVFYILQYTKTNNVIQKLYLENVNLVRKMSGKLVYSAMENKSVVEKYQTQMLETLNQMSDLLTYVQFKDPKGMLINRIGRALAVYVRRKKFFNPKFFLLSSQAKTDFSFATMVGQFEEMEENQTFYEQKVLRLIGTAYVDLLENREFDLSSLCARELGHIGKAALSANDDKLLDIVIIRFNTFLRFGIKHGVRNGELRNLYNALFHYSEFIVLLVKYERQDFVEKACRYFQIYCAEIDRVTLNEPSFVFLVDVFAVEMKKILVLLSEERWNKDFQLKILDLMLKMDDSPHIAVQMEDEESGVKLLNTGVRVIQTALGLYYLSVGKEDFAKRVAADMVKDYAHLDKESLSRFVEPIWTRLKMSGPKFWEDTDRGNSNMYYSADISHLPRFLEIFEESLLKL